MCFTEQVLRGFAAPGADKEKGAHVPARGNTLMFLRRLRKPAAGGLDRKMWKAFRKMVKGGV